MAVRSVCITGLSWMRLQRLAPRAAPGVLALLVAGCGLSVSPKVATTASPPAVVAATATDLYLAAPQDQGTVTFPPAALSCGAGDRTVKMTGVFGVDSMELDLTGLTAGRHLQFSATAPAFATAVNLTITGPFYPATFVAGPQQGAIVGTGTLSVAKTGAAGRFDLQLLGPVADAPAAVKGTWNCAKPESSPPTVVEVPPTLYLASSAPVVGECAVALQHQPLGAVTPLTCQGGAVNVLAWEYLIQYNAKVQGLGRNPSLGQVEGAFCPQYQAQATPLPVATDLYQIVAAYYGWHFSVPPATIASGVGC